MATRIEPIEQTLTAMVRAELAPEAQGKAIAAYARSQLAVAEEKNRRALGRTPAHTVTVDGRRGAALETVKPHGGRIVFAFEALTGGIIEWILAELVRRSPEKSGEYKRGHRVLADGVEISGAVPAAQEYVITNIVPYARRLEVGKTRAGRAFVIQVRPRIYEGVARDAKARFRSAATIRFGYRALAGIPAGRGKKKPAAPAIVVTMN